MKFDVITLFPEMFSGPLTESILKRAQEKGLIEINLHQLRDYALDRHKQVDDTPCGGGAGMVLKVDVIDRAIQSVILSGSEESQSAKILHSVQDDKKRRVILLSPSGEKFTQQKAIELAKYDNLILVCGHYEGFDHRIHEHLIDEEISIGDYVLTGGELPAMVMVDTISRMIPGVIRAESAANESFMDNEYDFPVYTRPIEYKDWKVPEVLLSGDHKKISEWRESNRKK